jgi:hypothetical protein
MIWNHRRNHGRRRPGHLGLLRLCLKLIAVVVAFFSLCLIFSLEPITGRVHASQVTSNIKLDADDLNHPLLLDQNGQLIRLPTAQHPGPVVMPAGAVATYIGYTLDSDDPKTTGLPTVQGDLANAPRTVGPLHFDPLDISQLNAALAHSGQAIVHTTDNTNVLVESIASFFGPNGTGSGTTGTSSTLAWLATQAAATSATTASSSASTTTPSTASSSGSTTPAAQTLIPGSVTNITSSITSNRVIKDLQHLLELKSGKLVNWNQQTLDALQRDLHIGTPHNVAAHLTTTKSQTAAEELAPPSAGVPQPAPIPEPSTMVVFCLAAGGLILRQKLSRRNRRG